MKACGMPIRKSFEGIFTFVDYFSELGCGFPFKIAQNTFPFCIPGWGLPKHSGHSTVCQCQQVFNLLVKQLIHHRELFIVKSRKLRKTTARCLSLSSMGNCQWISQISSLSVFLYFEEYQTSASLQNRITSPPKKVMSASFVTKPQAKIHRVSLKKTLSLAPTSPSLPFLKP